MAADPARIHNELTFAMYAPTCKTFNGDRDFNSNSEWVRIDELTAHCYTMILQCCYA